MSTNVPKKTNDFLQVLNKVITRSLDMEKTYSFHLLKSNLMILKHGNRTDSGYMEGVIGQSKEFYEKFGGHFKDKDKPEYSESDLYLMEMNKQLKNGERVKAKESGNTSQEMSFNKQSRGPEDNPNFEAGGFKSFEIEKIEDSHFSTQFNPIFERENENEASSQNEGEKGNDPANPNIFTRTGSLLENNQKNTLGKGPEGKIKISFQNDNLENGRNVQVETEGDLKVVGMGREGDVKVVDLKGEGDDIHLTIKEEVIINETIVTEYVDDSENKGKQGGEVGNVLLSSINQSNAQKGDNR